MHDQHLSLNTQLPRTLNSLSLTEVLAAIELLQNRLALMQSSDYYLQIPITDLPLPPSVISALLAREISTVRELKLCDWKQVKLFHRVGEKRVRELKNLLVKLEERKEEIKGLTGRNLCDALAKP